MRTKATWMAMALIGSLGAPAVARAQAALPAARLDLSAPKIWAAPSARERAVKLESSGKTMRAVGTGLLLLGIAATATGAVMSIYAASNTPFLDFESHPTPEQRQAQSFFYPGMISIMAGGGVIAGGAILMGLGRDRLTEAKRLRAVSLAPTLGPDHAVNGAAVSATLQF